MQEPTKGTQVARFGTFEVNFTAGELRKHGIRLKVQEQPLQVLALLLARPGELVTREEIQHKLWPSGTFVDFENGLNTAINRLREVLGDSAENPRFIVTEPRRGYRFIGHVDKPISEAPARRRPLTWVALAVTAVVIALSVYWVLAVRAPIRSIAILPLSASSPDIEYLSEGITDSLIESVSRLPQVKVISHTSAFHYKGKLVDPHTVGNELGVGAILTGSVLSRGDTLLVSVELVNTKDNTRLWGAQYDRKKSDLVAVQSDISREIREQLRLHLSGEQKRRLTASSTENSEAYQLFLRGQYYLFKRTPEDYETARRYYEQAIEKDPTFAAAYASLSHYYMQLADSGVKPLTEVGPTVKALANQAILLDPELGLGQSMLGAMTMFYDRNLREAERIFKLAMELNPNWVPTYRGYAICMRAMGRPEEALAAMKHARDLDPLSVAMNTSLGWEFYYAHRYTEAIEQFRTSTAMDPTFLFAQFGLASAYQQNRMEKEAILAWQDYITASGNSDLASELAKIYVSSGYAATMRMFRLKALELNTDAARDSYVSPMVFAGLQATLGNKDKAFSWLAKADTERSSKLLDLKVDPDFDNLRGDPRFTELSRRIGLP
jgi:TolB-like protein/DNA-binding winged helix-turn-helix (wHTH) protein/Tfp pilus assembly protein PilF